MGTGWERGRERGVGWEQGGPGGGVGNEAGTRQTGDGERGLVIFSPLYLCFADMSSHVDILHHTCPKWGNVITQKIR